ncbi:hypothetical protein V5799_018060 [Amblyomma americanum]|uniref:Uncharacterized protein n=1 Tax=Amblyomma americanum TaxID=6943 RepID=A0AAQ4F1H3_AMBAM
MVLDYSPARRSFSARWGSRNPHRDPYPLLELWAAWGNTEACPDDEKVNFGSQHGGMSSVVCRGEQRSPLK